MTVIDIFKVHKPDCAPGKPGSCPCVSPQDAHVTTRESGWGGRNLWPCFQVGVASCTLGFHCHNGFVLIVHCLVFILSNNIDINECNDTVSTSGCNHICNNSIGSYKCSCYNGYRLANGSYTFCVGRYLILKVYHILCDHVLLLDVDECLEGTDGCEGTCRNTIGSYQCMCPLGFRLGLDGHICEGK